MLSDLLNRKPLPEPAGRVGPDMKVLPGSKAEAIAQVERINNETQEATNSVIDQLGLSPDESPMLAQEVDRSAAGPTDDSAHLAKLNMPLN